MLSIMYDHACRVYKTMHEQASMRDIGHEGAPMVVWEGQLTKLIVKELNYSQPYYTFITGHLKRMGCIRMIRRGGGSSPSLWELIKEPNEEDFHKSEALQKPGQKPQDQVLQGLKDLGQRVAVIEKALGIKP
jgi:hypothetical protein